MGDDLKAQADACESVITLRRKLHDAADRIVELEQAHTEARASEAKALVMARHACRRANCDRLWVALSNLEIAGQPYLGPYGTNNQLTEAASKARTVLADLAANRPKSKPNTAYETWASAEDFEATVADQQGERDPYPVGPPDKLPADGHARRLRPTDDQQGERENGMADVSFKRQLERTRNDAWNAALEAAAKIALSHRDYCTNDSVHPGREYKASLAADFAVTFRSLKRGTP